MRRLLPSSLALFVSSTALADEPSEVTIAGTHVSHTAGSAHVIDEKRLERFRYDDPTQILTQVPGVYSRGEDGMGLRPNIGLRGVNPDRSKKVTLLEDGVLLGPAPYSAPAAYFFPLMPRMTSVRVIKGPAAISFGPQTVGGTIEYLTRPIPTTTRASIDLAIGQYGYGKAHGWAGTGDERHGVLLEAVHLQNDGFKELPGGADTGFSKNEFMAKAFYVLDPTSAVRHEFRIKGTYSDEVSNETYLGLSTGDFRDRPLQRYPASALDRMTWFHTAFAATHVMTASPELSVTTTVYRNDFSRTWRKVNRFRGADIFDVLNRSTTPRNQVYHGVLRGQDSTTPDEALFIGPNSRVFVSQGVETRARWSPETGPLSHRIEYGIRLHQDLVDRRHTEDAFLTQSGQLVPEGSATITAAFNRASTQSLAMHAIDAITWRDLTLTPGVRVETMRTAFADYKAGTEQKALAGAVLPGAGAFYALTPSLGVLAGAYRGFSPPTPESAAAGGKESSVNYEGGVRFAHGRARAELIGFYNDYQNLTDLCTENSGCAAVDQQFDAGEARIYGLEAFATHELRVVSGLSIPVTLAYTATRSELLSSFQSDDPIFGDVKKGDEIPYVPRHTLNASLGVDTALASGAVGMSYVAAMRELAGRGALEHTVATDDVLTFDASLTYRPRPWLSVYANVRNVFDEQAIVARRPFGARPNAPRWAQVGVKATFQ